jgi:diacylglycerol kinase
MATLHTPESARLILQVFSSALLAILFLQSGIDKVVDRRGNLEWLTGHFAKSFLAGMVPMMVTVITVMELVAGGLSAIGVGLILLRRDSSLAFYGAVVAGLTLIALFFGQRVAKDYAGAATLVPYFLLTSLAIYLLAWNS